jgi:hypothetical protein
MLTAFSIKTQYLHRCSQRKRPTRKAASKGGLSQNVGQTTFCVKGLHKFAKIKPKFTVFLFSAVGCIVQKH